MQFRCFYRWVVEAMKLHLSKKPGNWYCAYHQFHTSLHRDKIHSILVTKSYMSAIYVTHTSSLWQSSLSSRRKSNRFLEDSAHQIQSDIICGSNYDIMNTFSPSLYEGMTIYIYIYNFYFRVQILFIHDWRRRYFGTVAAGNHHQVYNSVAEYSMEK
jgi:hypothetical protein